MTPTFYVIDPVPAPRMLRSDIWKERECVVQYRQFKDHVRGLGVTLPEPPYTVVFYLPFPPGYSEKKRAALRGQPHTLKPDLDNLLKALWDALDKQDQQQWSISVEKRWCSHRPGILVFSGRDVDGRPETVVSDDPEDK
jgi:hypothetical protein